MSRPPLALAGRTAVITGAGSGIGRALAINAAKQAMRVAVCDVDAEGLAETARLIEAAGGEALTAIVDVSENSAIEGFAARVLGQLPPVALLFANAGILRQGGVLGLSTRDWQQLFDVNVMGVVHVLKAFVPAMVGAADPSQVIVTGSTGTMSNPQGLAAYCATKHALWPIAEELRRELQERGAPVGVSLLMPGSVATKIFAQSQPDRPTAVDSLDPTDVADIIFASLGEDPFFVLTHPGFVDRAEARFAAVVAELRR